MSRPSCGRGSSREHPSRLPVFPTGWLWTAGPSAWWLGRSSAYEENPRRTCQGERAKRHDGDKDRGAAIRLSVAHGAQGPARGLAGRRRHREGQLDPCLRPALPWRLAVPAVRRGSDLLDRRHEVRLRDHRRPRHQPEHDAARRLVHRPAGHARDGRRMAPSFPALLAQLAGELREPAKVARRIRSSLGAGLVLPAEQYRP